MARVNNETLKWMPDHTDINGNETTDSLTRAGFQISFHGLKSSCERTKN